MNFIEDYKKGQQGDNKGIPLGKGLNKVSNAINGLQKRMMYGLAAGPKVGKSTLADAGFIIEPYEYCVANNILDDFECIYNSYEIDRISKEFDFAAHYLERLFGISNIKLEGESTYKGLDIIPMSANYLRGRLIDDSGEVIKVKPLIEDKLKEVYQTRIIPLFGEYSAEGILIKPGKIQFLTHRENPTGIYKFLLQYAEKNGKFVEQIYKINEGGKQITKKRRVGYSPNNPKKIVLIVTDHLRKIIPERGFTLKQTIDKYIEYSVELRNMCGFSFLHIIHLNRNMADIARIKYAGDTIYPNGDDVKDSGNLSEEADFMFTMQNPNDDRYGLKTFFSNQIRGSNNDLIYPNMRSLHLVENRHGDSPQHFLLNMIGNTKRFERLEIS